MRRSAVFRLTGRGGVAHKRATETPPVISRGVVVPGRCGVAVMGECPERQRGRTVNPLATPS